MRLTCLKMVIHVPETHLEAKVSQNLDIGLSFNLIAYRNGEIQKNSKSYRLFIFKIEANNHIKYLRHPPLDENVFHTY